MKRIGERSCKGDHRLHVHTYMGAISKLENAASLRADMRIVPPIIVQMLVMARCAIFYACSAADCAASNAKATTSKVAAPLKSTCSWQFIDGGDFFQHSTNRDEIQCFVFGGILCNVVDVFCHT